MKIFKTTQGVSILVLAVLVIVVAWIYDSHNKGTFYGLFAVNTAAPLTK